MVAPSRFCHVVIKSHQAKAMVDWYINVLACRVQGTGDGITFLTYDEEHHRIAIKDLGAGDELNASRLRRTAGVAHFAFAWDDIGGLLEVYKRGKAYGVLPIRSTRHGVTISFYYDDPDKNNLEFQVDLMDVEAANEYMLTDAFRANPHGELFDPEELAQRFETGASVDDLIYRSDQPQRLGSLVSRHNPIVSFDSLRKSGFEAAAARNELPTDRAIA